MSDRRIARLVRRYPYPRRRPLRRVLRFLAGAAFRTLADLEVIGRENLPERGPLIVVANHFSFADPALMVSVVPWPIEFLAAVRAVNAPGIVHWIPWLWGAFRTRRGSVGARSALEAGEAVLRQGGVLGIYPEAGSWATVLRPARPGTAYLAVRTGAPILPMGFDGLPHLFPHLRRGRRAKVTVRIGKVFGPFRASGRGQERRRQLEEIGHEIMRHVAELLPPEKRGYYSPDPAIRQAALAVAEFPYADLDG